MEFKWCNCTWKCTMDGGRIVHLEQPWQWYSNSENVVVLMRNGEIHLYCKSSPRKIHYGGKFFTADYEVGTIRSKENFEFGTFSCEIKLPEGMNLWPSFWLTGDGNWPPEIDICEAWSGNNDYFKWFIAQPPYFSPSWRTTTNVHYNNERMEHESVGTRNISICKQHKNPSKNFIKYECEWLPNKITFKVDDKIVRTITGHVCKKFTNNLTNPKNGCKMNVIFNVWCEDPATHTIRQDTPLVIRNFEYKPMKK